VKSRPFSLDWLLHPTTTDAFVTGYWEERPLFVRRQRRDYFVGLLELEDVEELVTATTPRATRSAEDGGVVRTEQSGTFSRRSIALGANGIPDIYDVYHAYNDGYTLVLNQIHRRSSAVALLCRTLEQALHHHVGANLYLTPREAQGFRPHWDDHDVFILQLHGIKEWRVSTEAHQLPVGPARHQVRRLGDFDAFRLEPGDLLYLPRGVVHEAVTSASSSLHLTVGIHVSTWIDLLDEVLKVLREDREDLRTALPPGFLDQPLEAACLANVARQLAGALGDNGVVERAKERLGERLLRGGRAAAGGHFRSLDAIPTLRPGSQVVRTPGVLCRVRCSTEEARIEFDTNFVAGPTRLEPALRFVAAQERFTIKDLPGDLSSEDKLDLVTRLVVEGLLACTPTNGEATDG
jgi:ribosomal protein L16 Arg81 hydroxylase